MRIIAAVCVLALSGVACAREGAAIEAPSGPTLVVANQRDGVATLVDLNSGRVLGHIDVGMDPHEVAVSPDGRTVALVSPSAWWNLRDGNTVAIVDVATARLIKTIDLGEYAWLHGVVFRDSRTLLVSSRSRAAVVFVDIGSGQIIGDIDNGGSQPYLLHIVPATQRGYTSNPFSSSITEVDLESRRLLRTWKNADEPAGFAVSPRGDTVWFATGTDDVTPAISVLDLMTGEIVQRIEGSTHARRFAFSPDASTVVASEGDVLRVFDTGSRQEIGRVQLGAEAGASGVTFNRDGSRCYVALSIAGAVAEIDVSRLTVLRRFDVGDGADGIAFVPLNR